MGQLLEMPAKTYKAKLFEVLIGISSFKLAGTLDGFIDFAIPDVGTYPLSLDEARLLVAALTGAISDIEANCLYERDCLLVDR